MTLEETFPQILHNSSTWHSATINGTSSKTTLENAGFVDVTIESVSKRCEGGSARQVATGFITATPLRNALQQRGNVNVSGTDRRHRFAAGQGVR